MVFSAAGFPGKESFIEKSLNAIISKPVKMLNGLSIADPDSSSRGFQIFGDTV